MNDRPLQSHPQLLRLFRRFNKNYFDGALPEPLIYYSNVDGENCFGECQYLDEGDEYIIRIHPMYNFNRSFRQLTVLHEMVHVKLHFLHKIFNHGKAFQAEMLRLATIGALKNIW